jgi:hypothetical protein
MAKVLLQNFYFKKLLIISLFVIGLLLVACAKKKPQPLKLET